MATLKTQPNDASVEAFLATIEDERKRGDAETLLKLFKGVTRQPAKMWGGSIIGFGTYHYVYASGREGDWFLAGFSPRKQNLAIYVMSGFGIHKDNLAKLGKYKAGKSCLYVKRLEDIDLKVLRAILRESVAYVKKHQGCCGHD